jgi:tape measure domain-containing protein
VADTIGNLAYRVKFDATQLTRGLLTTRQEMASARKITDSMRAPLDGYTNAVKNLDSMLQKKLITDNQHEIAQMQLQRQMLETEATTRRLTVAEMDQLKSLRALDSGIKTTAQDEANRAKAMQRGREITEQTRSSQDKLNRSLAEARKLYREGAISAGTYAQHVAQLKKDAAGPGLLAGMGGVKGAVGAIGAAAGVGSLLSISKDAIQMSADVERASASMEAFTGSGAKAAAMLDYIRKLSSVAGIGFRSLNQGASAMLGYGVATDVTSKKLRQFAEISRGDTERFNSLALAFGQVNAAGRLMGQEVLQMVNAGFNPLQEIARTTGIEFSTLKKMMENGQVSVDMVSKAFDTATSAGGRFNGMLDTIGKTSAGSLGRLGAEWEIFLDKLGKSMPVKAGADAMTSTLSIGSSIMSSEQDAIQRRMDEAKKSDGKGLNDWGIGTSGYTELSEAAQKDNRLDEQINKLNENNPRIKAFEENKKRQEELKVKEEERKKRVQEGMKNIAATRQQSMLDQRREQNPEAFDKFTKITEMLDEPKKKMATEDFARFGNLNRILPLLDRELQIEFKKLDLLKQQNIAREDRPIEKDQAKEQMTATDKMAPRVTQQKSVVEREEGKKEQKDRFVAPTTNSGLTCQQHEMASYGSYDQAMAAEEQLRKAEMMQRQKMMVQQMQEQVKQLPAIEVRREEQAKAHSPVASIQAGSAAAYEMMVKNKTRADIKNDPSVKLLDKQITHLKEVRDSIKTLSDKFDIGPA